MKKILLALLAPIFAGAAFISPAQATVEAKTPAPVVMAEYVIKVDGSVVPANEQAKSAARQAQETQSCTWATNGKCYWYTGGQFIKRAICVQNDLGVYWNYVNAENGLQSGTSTVTFFNHGASTGTTSPCSEGAWETRQIMDYQAYNVADGNCARVLTHVDALGFYDAPILLKMNIGGPAGCTDTLQHRNNTVSAGFGLAIGLAKFSSSTNLTAAVMNTYFSYAYNYPGVDDRNAAYFLYYSLGF